MKAQAGVTWNELISNIARRNRNNRKINLWNQFLPLYTTSCLQRHHQSKRVTSAHRVSLVRTPNNRNAETGPGNGCSELYVETSDKKKKRTYYSSRKDITCSTCSVFPCFVFRTHPGNTRYCIDLAPMSQAQHHFHNIPETWVLHQWCSQNLVSRARGWEGGCGPCLNSPPPRAPGRSEKYV